MWAALFLTLPTRPSGVRLRLWRALKALGCGALRDGVYLLPRAQAPALRALAAEARELGGQASLMWLQAPDDEAEAQLRALFDRGDDYAAWRAGAEALRAQLPRLSEAEARRRLRAQAAALQALQQIDYLPGPASQQALAALDALRAQLDRQHAPDEPSARAARGAGALQRLDRARFQGRVWATRARPWVDRLASAWLIGRFIDETARFVWLAPGQRPPRGALGFDYDGARFSHEGARVSFEVLLARFGLDDNPALRHIGAIVHALDAGGIPVPEAAGLEAVLAGLREQHADDDALLAAAAAVFDALLVAAGQERPR